MGEDRDSEPSRSREQPPGPLPQFDCSPAASRRRGIRLFHVVLLVLGGGVAVWAGAWLIAVVVCAIVLAFLARGRQPEIAAAIARTNTELTETYEKLVQVNKEIDDARRARAEDQGVRIERDHPDGKLPLADRQRFEPDPQDELDG